jgi:hypothetical protein
MDIVARVSPVIAIKVILSLGGWLVLPGSVLQ